MTFLGGLIVLIKLVQMGLYKVHDVWSFYVSYLTKYHLLAYETTSVILCQNHSEPCVHFGLFTKQMTLNYSWSLVLWTTLHAYRSTNMPLMPSAHPNTDKVCVNNTYPHICNHCYKHCCWKSMYTFRNDQCLHLF